MKKTKGSVRAKKGERSAGKPHLGIVEAGLADMWGDLRSLARDLRKEGIAKGEELANAALDSFKTVRSDMREIAKIARRMAVRELACVKALGMRPKKGGKAAKVADAKILKAHKESVQDIRRCKVLSKSATTALKRLKSKVFDLKKLVLAESKKRAIKSASRKPAVRKAVPKARAKGGRRRG